MGQLIFIDDGLMSLEVKAKKGPQSLLCKVVNGGQYLVWFDFSVLSNV